MGRKGHLDLSGNTQAPHQCSLLGGPSTSRIPGPPALSSFLGRLSGWSFVKGDLLSVGSPLVYPTGEARAVCSSEFKCTRTGVCGICMHVWLEQS